MVDVNKVLKDVIKKGKVKIGEKQTKKAIKDGTAKIVILSNNCPYSNDVATIVKNSKTPVYNYSANGVELGYVCGKNFAVSSFAVIDIGESNIMQLAKTRK